MKVGLLQCDHVPKHLLSIGGDYPEMFNKFLPGVSFSVYDICHNQFPASVHDCDIYLMSGSKHSVYDRVDWIDRCKELVRDVYAKNKYFVGICFGHQMMAEALGGKVQKSDHGWCVGVHHFTLSKKLDWMAPYPKHFNIIMSCQDQVISLPENSHILAQSSDCPIGMFTIGEKMLGIQGHPEFPKQYSQKLIEERINKIGIVKGQQAQASLKTNPDVRTIAQWVMKFTTLSA